VEAVRRTLTRPQHEPRCHESSRSGRSERSSCCWPPPSSGSGG